MAGGIATLEIMSEPGSYEALEDRSAMLAAGLQQGADAAGVPLTINRVGSMLTPFFVKTPGAPVRDYAEATASDTAAYAIFFHAMLSRGIMLAPSQYEAMFVSLVHTEEAIEQTISAAKRAFEAVAETRLLE
jgi:glutamate-1-semialdehyde 2,1-aminomutase